MTQGWFCPHCQRGLRPVEVTYEETCTTCGTCVTDVEPPAALAEIEGLVERLHELDWGKWPAVGEAAAALETLSARVGELERRYTERDEQLTAEFSVSSEARARAARMEAALREIEYLDRPQVRGQPRRKSIQEVALAALSTEAKAQGGEHE